MINLTSPPDYGLDLSGVERDVALPDLVAEGDELDALVSARTDWSLPTPATGWTIAHQIAHLAAADANVLIAMRTPEEFAAVLSRAEAAGGAHADLDAAAGAAKPRSRCCWNSGVPVEPPWRRPSGTSHRTRRFRGTARR